jgi:DNA mismatch endonuclease (patch repair protein)
MPDTVDKDTRSRIMSQVRSKNTTPELAVRSLLHRNGYRFRIHVKSLPGTPDIVLPKYHAVVLVHGCFWHGHTCHLYRLPKSRQEWWQEKVRRNREKDIRQIDELVERGWRVCTVWECALKRKGKLDSTELMRQLEQWLGRGEELWEIRGNDVGHRI